MKCLLKSYKSDKVSKSLKQFTSKASLLPDIVYVIYQKDPLSD